MNDMEDTSANLSESSIDAFALLATLTFPEPARLLKESWCPDKDLLLLVTRIGSKDKMSLWQMQGTRKWEVDVDTDAAREHRIVDIAWSPDGA
jgi:anaphase-promoting complex subunit 4